MIFRYLVLSVVLVANVFAPYGAFSSSGFPAELRADNASAQKTARATAGFDSAYRLSLPNPLQDKNFFLLSLFQRSPRVRRLLSGRPALKELSNAKLQALKQSADCNDMRCFVELMRLDDPTIAAVAKELETLSNRPEFKLLIKNDLRRSGVFIKYREESDAQMLVAAWKDAANGMNRILSVYGLGNDPRYKEIDRVSFDVSKQDYVNLVKEKTTAINASKATLFFEPTLNFALKLLEINRRDEAARYEPLEQGENKAAVQNLKNIRWGDYPYSFILVLGSGPANSARLSPIGARRTDGGAELFLQHKAPLIIVSGGHVHPMQTPYCEAIEMKKYLMEKYKIPAKSILVEPHARHTTSNFRNAARLVFRYRIPATLTALVTSTDTHITYSVGEEFHTRCLDEFGYFPIESIKQIAPNAAEFKPSVVSLFFDANDPLDP